MLFMTASVTLIFTFLIIIIIIIIGLTRGVSQIFGDDHRNYRIHTDICRFSLNTHQMLQEYEAVVAAYGCFGCTLSRCGKTADIVSALCTITKY